MTDYAAKLAELQEELAELKAQKKAIISTGQSWSLRNGEDNRGVTNVSLAELNKEIADLERKIAQIEGLMNGGNPGGIRVRGALL